MSDIPSPEDLRSYGKLRPGCSSLQVWRCACGNTETEGA